MYYSFFFQLLYYAYLMGRQIKVVFEHDSLLLKVELYCVYDGRVFLNGITFGKKISKFLLLRIGLCENLIQKKKNTLHVWLEAKSKMGT